MSTKGQSVVAARRLVDNLCRVDGGVPLLVLHDFDKWGLSIAENLTEVSWQAEESNRVRYEFQNQINVIDLGLRLADVEQWNLASERVRFKGRVPSSASTVEREFLKSGRRVELNAFTSADFIKWIEGMLAKHGIKKVIPNDETIEAAYRRSLQAALINAEIEEFAERASEQAEQAKLPKGLTLKIKKALKENPAECWDGALATIVQSQIENQG